MDEQGGERDFPKSLNVVSIKGGATRVFIDVEINKAGDLVMSGQDVGAAPLQMFDDSDYEYWVTVPARYKDWLLLSLLKDRFEGDAGASSAFREWLDERHIPNRFSSY